VCIDDFVSSRRVIVVPFLAVACQAVFGIEVRDEYRPGVSSDGGGGDDGGEAGSAGAVTSGGSSGEAGAPGSAGEGTGGGEPSEPVCGDGKKEGSEVCDDGGDNGEHGNCDVSCLFVCEGQCPIRVDPKITAAGDGKTWKTAFRSLQDAVDQQEEAGGGEVWVKTGTFAASGSDTMLTLKSGVDVYGGFAGNELDRLERETPTIDRATTLDANEVSYPAVLGDGVQHVTFDGFVVRNAAGANGPAFQATGSSDLTLSHVFFSDNSATDCGGAMWLENAEIRLEGGAFEDNHADASGGAICAERATKLEVEGTRFVDNDAVQRGGAIDAYGTYSPEAKPDLAISSATFIGNRATREDEPSSGGGALYQMAGTLTIVDSDFKANSASIQSGAAVYLNDVAADVYNSVFAENEGFLTAFHTEVGGPVHIVGCTFAFNDVNCPGPCSVSGDATVVENSLSVVTEKIQWPGFASSVNETTNCDVFISGGLGYIASPFGTAPLLDRDENGVEDYLLLVVPSEESQPCFYQGSDSVADAAGVPWKSLTTSGNNCLDISPVDMGRHYEPTNANPTACE
jgi:hypothetical protein